MRTFVEAFLLTALLTACTTPSKNAVNDGNTGDMATAKILIFSGRDNPSIALTPEEFDRYKNRIMDLPRADIKPGTTVIPNTLGYIGIMLFPSANLENNDSTEYVELAGGIISLSGTLYFYDETREVERDLLSRGLEYRVIDEYLYKIIAQEIDGV